MLISYMYTNTLGFDSTAFLKSDEIMKQGNMYAQHWSHIYKHVVPYPDVKDRLNITAAMLNKEMEPIDMFMMAEKFFTSIGMKKMNPRFWQFSVLEKPKGDRKVNCHASAHNMNDGEDFRIKMCSTVDASTLETVHHEMGHIQYYMHYSHLPYAFQGSTNPGVHEAIGNVISLSVKNAKYLKSIGLINSTKTSKESTINFLMSMALDHAVGPFYAYIIDLWRNQVYDGSIKENELNKKYWKYRLQYQGVCPPVRRSEKNFDIGAKYHIAAGVEYWRYFVANILQFQLHEYLCRQTGHKGPVHNCTIYKKRKAGKRLA
ncbi:angiotensin-converting enzyme [Trichonephila clavata]|uniref:Angiotensin-converting enzyme n=1 Tax=Trichonephila clavata TaxID=2740835 RepID=A0A8X6I2Z6_TRICU|nr:angiotensin-converting enzyme [Trichonephila clavata]